VGTELEAIRVRTYAYCSRPLLHLEQNFSEERGRLRDRSKMIPDTTRLTMSNRTINPKTWSISIL